MARIDIEIIDCTEGHAHFQFVFDPPLPEDLSLCTPAQIEALRLIELMDSTATPAAVPVDPMKMN